MRVGDVIDGKYELVELLGEGGMGAVFVARHLRIGRSFALKALHPRFAENAEMVERFVREAKAAAAIGSEHIVEVTDAGESDDGTPFIVMAFLEGRTLSDVLAEEGALEPERAIKLLLQVCEGLEAAHQRGIVHRDLKPGNLIVTVKPDGSEWVTVVDFGVAKVRDALPTMATQTPELTGTTATLGTPYYMAPEQAWGSKRATPRSDVYAAGVVLFELITGGRPFRAESYNELIVRIATEEPPLPRSLRPEIDEALEAVIVKAMAREPDDRYGSMAELAAALAELAGVEIPDLGSTAPERIAAKREQVERAAPKRRDDEQELALARTARSPSEPPEAEADSEEDDDQDDDQDDVEIGVRRRVLVIVIVAAVAAAALSIVGAVMLIHGGGWAILSGGTARRGGALDADVSGRGSGHDDASGALLVDGSLDAAIDGDVDGGVDGDVECPAAMVRNEDTWGHCCWPAQVWSKTRSECIGEPDCPTETAWRGGCCVCPEGMSITIDTQDHCCWPGQAWSLTQERCVGPAQCGPGFRQAGREGCEPDEESALGRLIAGCQREEMASCVTLGEAYQGGRAADREHAVVLFRQGCEGGEARGCALLGNAYDSGRGVARSHEKAAEAFLQSCIGGEANACTRIGDQYLEGRGVDASSSRAASFFRKGCNGAHQEACVALGELYLSGRGVERSEAGAVKLFTSACDEGEARGCALLASAYDQGQGVAVSYEKAATLARAACDNGAPTACTLAGRLYNHGRGVSVDHGLAVRYAQRGCDAGDAEGCRDLGLLYQKGIGVRQDFGAAVKAYRKACDGGDAFGCRNLAIRYRRGEGVPLDNDLAVRWYERACLAGDERSCGLAGDILVSGTDVARDVAKGRELLRRGCQGGDQWSCERLSR